MQSFKSFADMAAAIRASERKSHTDDMRRAQNLTRSRSIANVKPGTGPRIAR